MYLPVFLLGHEFPGGTAKPSHKLGAQIVPWILEHSSSGDPWSVTDPDAGGLQGTSAWLSKLGKTLIEEDYLIRLIRYQLGHQQCS